MTASYTTSRDTTPSAFWPLVDQGIVSVGGFGVTLALARTLAPLDFGVFSLVFLAILQIQVFMGSLIFYPLSVRGTVASSKERMELFGNGLLLMLSGVVPLSLGLAAALAAAGLGNLIIPVLGWFVLGQTQELLRRGLFSDMRYLAAIPGDVLRYLGQAALVVTLAAFGRLTIVNAVTAMAVCAAIALAVQAFQFPIRLSQIRHLPTTAGDCWRIGYGSLGSNLLATLSVQVFPWLLAFEGGAAAASVYTASANAIGVASPVLVGLCNIIPQAVARDLRRNGPLRAWQASLRYMVLGAVPTLGYYVFALMRPGLILATLYGSASPYVSLSAPIRLMALAAVVGFGVEMTNAYLHGIEEAHLSMRVNALGFAVCLIIGVPLTMMAGLLGSCTTLVVSNLVRAFGAGVMLRPVLSKPQRGSFQGTATRSARIESA